MIESNFLSEQTVPITNVCGDICIPLVDLWKEMRDNPDALADGYCQRWHRLQSEGYTAYYEIRDDFNRDQSPYDLLFLSRTCVNGLIRFHDKGEFNNSCITLARVLIRKNSVK